MPLSGGGAEGAKRFLAKTAKMRADSPAHHPPGAVLEDEWSMHGLQSHDYPRGRSQPQFFAVERRQSLSHSPHGSCASPGTPSEVAGSDRIAFGRRCSSPCSSSTTRSRRSAVQPFSKDFREHKDFKRPKEHDDAKLRFLDKEELRRGKSELRCSSASSSTALKAAGRDRGKEQVEMRLCPPARHVHGGDELCSSACASTKQKEPVEVERELNVTKELDTEREQCGSDKYFLPKVMGKTPQPEEASAESATSLLYDKLKNIIELLKERLVDRDEVIRMLLLALVTHQNALLLGPPGTGKSHVCKMLASMISDTHKEQGKAFFEAQFHPSTTVEDIFGAISLSGLAENRITRNVRQMLPYASVAFLDEAFKAQSIAFVMLALHPE